MTENKPSCCFEMAELWADVQSGASAVTENAISTEQLSDQMQWYAVYTRPRHEKVVERVLQFGEIECFLPLFEAERRWHDRYKIIHTPLFPSYLFVHISALQRRRVVMTPGVVCLVSSLGRPVAVPEFEITAIRNYLSMHLPAEPYPYVAAGRRVYIASGPLAGLHGVVLRQKNRCRVVISLDLIMRSMVADVSTEDLMVLPLPKPAAGIQCDRLRV